MAHQDTITELEQEIYRLKILRDAQEEGSALYLRFQEQINRTTRSMIDWEDAAPTLGALGTAITDAERHLTSTRRARNYAVEQVTSVTKACAVVGLVLLVACLLFSVPWWVGVLCAAAFVGAGAGVLGATRVRHSHAAAIEDAKARVTSLKDQWRQTTPDKEQWVPALDSVDEELEYEDVD